MIAAENWTFPFDRAINQLLFSVCSSSRHDWCMVRAGPHACVRYTCIADWQSAWRVDLLLTTISVRHIKHLCGTVVRRRQTLGFVRHWWAVKDGEVIRGAGHKWRTLWIQWTMDVIVFRRRPRASLPGCRYSSSLPCTDDGACMATHRAAKSADGWILCTMTLQWASVFSALPHKKPLSLQPFYASSIHP